MVVIIIILIILIVATLLIVFIARKKTDTDIKSDPKSDPKLDPKLDPKKDPNPWTDMECWNEKQNLAIPILMEMPSNESDPYKKCQLAATNYGANVFGLRNGGLQCALGFGSDYKKYGKNTACESKGTPLITRVYTSSEQPNWIDVGCWNDKAERAIPISLSITDPNNNLFEKCKNVATEKGYNTFALQNTNECYAGNNPDYKKYGVFPEGSTCGNLGGYWGNRVYVKKV